MDECSRTAFYVFINSKRGKDRIPAYNAKIDDFMLYDEDEDVSLTAGFV